MAQSFFYYVLAVQAHPVWWAIVISEMPEGGNPHKSILCLYSRPAIVLPIAQCRPVPRLAIHISWRVSVAQKLCLLSETPCHGLYFNTKF